MAIGYTYTALYTFFRLVFALSNLFNLAQIFIQQVIIRILNPIMQTPGIHLKVQK